MSEESGGEIDRCAVCGDRVVSVVDALHHYLKEHPRSELLHDTASGVNVRIDCSECGASFTTNLSVSVDRVMDEATLTVASYCDGCVEHDLFFGLIVRHITPNDVLEREVTDGAE